MGRCHGPVRSSWQRLEIILSIYLTARVTLMGTQSRERRTCDYSATCHSGGQLRRLIHRTFVELRTHCCLPCCCGFLFGLLFKVKTFGIIMVSFEEKIAINQDEETSPETTQPTLIIYHIINKVKTNLKDTLLSFKYRSNFNFIMKIHILKHLLKNSLV